jgi:hypothetical protein
VKHDRDLTNPLYSITVEKDVDVAITGTRSGFVASRLPCCRRRSRQPLERQVRPEPSRLAFVKEPFISP